MPTTYTNGLKLPDLGSIDWFNAYKNNIDILDPIVGTVNGVATTYAPISHNHDASEITSGTIDIARLPPAALERLTTVADQTARYALTTSTIQLGDTVKQLDTGIMYLVVDTTKLNSADGYVEYSAGTASKAIADEDGTSIKTGYVNVAGNQTVTGQKDWSSLQTFSYGQIRIKSLTQEIGVTPSTSVIQYLEFADKNNAQHGKVGLWDYDNGASEIQMSISDKYKNGAKDSTGTSDTTFLSFGFRYNGVKFLTFSGQVNNSIIPLATNSYSLGSSSYQWSSVYAQSYYYNGTAWGLEQNNTWTGINTFSSTIYSKIDATTLASYKDIYQCQNDSGNRVVTLRVTHSNSARVLSINVHDNSNSAPKGIVINNDGNNNISLTGSGASNDLGTSTNKWKTLNGINPGALSLPSNTYTGSNAIVEIDRTGWVYDGTANSYSPLVDCWLSISNGGSITVWGTNTAFGMKATDNIAIPLRQGETYNVSLTRSPDFCRIYPCLGNV